MKKLVCFHLLNNYSGSPKVLKSVLQKMLEKGISVDLVTSGADGALSELAKYPNIKFKTYKYRFSGNLFATSFRYARTQIYTFFYALKYTFDKDTVFYINTILPVMPAFAGKIIGKKVVYHYHENAYARGLFYRFLCSCMQILAHKIICVSNYQRSFLKRTRGVSVVSNALPDNFVCKVNFNTFDRCKNKNILLISSLKEYKGIADFFTLAGMLLQYTFTLVIGDEQSMIDRWLEHRNLRKPDNMEVYACQKDTAPFYENASIVVNLSNKLYTVETFGMTILEALSFGLPVIVPTVGGVSELVEDGMNGYKIDVQNLPEISDRITQILENTDIYEKLSKNALKIVRKYNMDEMTSKIYGLLTSK